MQVNKNAAFRAMDQFVHVVGTAVETLRTAVVEAGFTTREDVHPLVLEWASKRHGVALVESKSNRNKGALVLDRSNPSFDAADKAYKRMVESLVGDADAEAGAASNAKTERVATPDDVAALARKLVAAVLQYDLDERGLKALAAQAVAEAFKAAKAK
jgi:hypothetical protein